MPHITQQTLEFAQVAYKEYLILLFENPSAHLDDDAAILPAYERFRDVGIDLELNFWKEATEYLEPGPFDFLIQRLYGLQKLADHLAQHEEVAKANADLDKAAVKRSVMNTHDVLVDYEVDKSRIRVSVRDPLESYCCVEFHLTFTLEEAFLKVAVETDSMQNYMIWSDEARWNNPINKFPLDTYLQFDVPSTEVTQWACQWMKEFLCSYLCYANANFD